MPPAVAIGLGVSPFPSQGRVCILPPMAGRDLDVMGDVGAALARPHSSPWRAPVGHRNVVCWRGPGVHVPPTPTRLHGHGRRGRCMGLGRPLNLRPLAMERPPECSPMGGSWALGRRHTHARAFTHARTNTHTNTHTHTHMHAHTHTGNTHTHTHTQTHDENRETRTEQRKAVAETPQELQSSPRRLSVW